MIGALESLKRSHGVPMPPQMSHPPLESYDRDTAFAERLGRVNE